MNHSKAIKEYREKVLITQAELAKKLSISFVSANRWERGLFEPTIAANRKLKVLFEEQEVFVHGKQK